MGSNNSILSKIDQNGPTDQTFSKIVQNVAKLTKKVNMFQSGSKGSTIVKNWLTSSKIVQNG